MGSKPESGNATSTGGRGEVMIEDTEAEPEGNVKAGDQVVKDMDDDEENSGWFCGVIGN